jgi:membrane protease subunit HflK
MSLRRLLTFTGVSIGIVILAIVGLTTWYTVDESDQAVILTLGKVDTAVIEPGLHFKLPWPIQDVEKGNI